MCKKVSQSCSHRLKQMSVGLDQVQFLISPGQYLPTFIFIQMFYSTGCLVCPLRNQIPCEAAVILSSSLMTVQVPKSTCLQQCVYLILSTSGPQCYVQPQLKSNKKLIKNALCHACLAGEVNVSIKQRALTVSREGVATNCEAHHYC